MWQKDLFGILVMVNVKVIKCDIGEYVDYENCKCRKNLVVPIIDECTETVEKLKLARITLAENENSYKCSSFTAYTVLLWIFFTINVSRIIVTSFIFFVGTQKKMLIVLSLILALKQIFTKHINARKKPWYLQHQLCDY